MLTSEEEFCQETLSKLMDRLRKTNIKTKCETAMFKLQDYQKQIYAKENDLMFIETSAVLNSNVVYAFQLLIESKLFPFFDVLTSRNIR